MDVQDDRRFRHLASAAVIAVVIVAVLSVLLALGAEEGGADEPVTYGPSSDAIIVSDTEFIELSGDFEDGTLTARLQGSGQLEVTLSSAIAEDYDSFTWILRDEIRNESQYITKNSGANRNVLTWVSPSVGTYSFTVVCQSTSTGETATYLGALMYCGDVHSQNSFEYGGVTYTVYVDVGYYEYIEYVTADTSSRYSPSVTDGASFITESTSVTSLAQRLSEQYLAANPGSDTSGADYAGYVLAFVQSCFAVGSDTYYHSASVYWAYPAETLYTGVGDSGDLAVLAASILNASGYDAGIAMIQGHSFLAVSLDRYTAPSDIPDGFRTLRVSVGGTYYYLCELAEGVVPAGCVPEFYGYSSGRYTYYGETAEDGGIALP